MSDTFVYLGAPGAGKGTLASLYCEKHKIPHISTGALFRYHLKEKTELGQRAASYMEQGNLVPDELTNAMVAERLGRADCGPGFLLDGYPRNLAQAQELDRILGERGRSLDHVVLVDVPVDMIILRLSGRRVCSGCGMTYNVEGKMPVRDTICDLCGEAVVQRADDREDVIRHRLTTYEEKTLPLVDYYEKKGILLRVCNTAAAEETLLQLEQQLAVC